MDLCSHSAIFLFEIHLDTGALSEIKREIVRRNGTTTANVSGATTILTKAGTLRRIQLDLRSKGLYTSPMSPSTDANGSRQQRAQIHVYSVDWLKRSFERGAVLPLEDFVSYRGYLHSNGEAKCSIPLSIADPTTLSFLELPPEIRTMIYRNVLVGGEASCGRAWPAILRACRQVYGEAVGLYYAENDFTVHIRHEAPDSPSIWVASLGPVREEDILTDALSATGWPGVLRTRKVVKIVITLAWFMPPALQKVDSADEQHLDAHAVINFAIRHLLRFLTSDSTTAFERAHVTVDFEGAISNHHERRALHKVLGVLALYGPDSSMHFFGIPDDVVAEIHANATRWDRRELTDMLHRMNTRLAELERIQSDHDDLLRGLSDRDMKALWDQVTPRTIRLAGPTYRQSVDAFAGKEEEDVEQADRKAGHRHLDLSMWINNVAMMYEVVGDPRMATIETFQRYRPELESDELDIMGMGEAHDRAQAAVARHRQSTAKEA